MSWSWVSSSSTRCNIGVTGGVVASVRTGVTGSSGISSTEVGGSFACWGWDRSTTGEGGSAVTCGVLSGVATSYLVCDLPASSTNGSRTVVSEDASSTYWGTWALGPPPSLTREGRALGQDTFSKNWSTDIIGICRTTSYRVYIIKICPWNKL